MNLMLRKNDDVLITTEEVGDKIVIFANGISIVAISPTGTICVPAHSLAERWMLREMGFLLNENSVKVEFND